LEQVLFGGYLNLLPTVTTEYNSLMGGLSWSATELYVYGLVSTDGLIKQLRLKLYDVAGDPASPGAGKKYTFTLMLNGAPTALTFDIADAATSGSNMVTEIDITGGDTVSLQCDPDNTPTARYAAWSCVFEGDTEKESLIFGVASDYLHQINTEYGQVMCAAAFYSLVENDHRQVVPTAGTIKNLYVKLSIDPGTAPEAFRFTLRKGGASQTLTVTITADDTTGSDLVNSFAVVAGDILTIMVEPLNVPSETPRAAWGMTFVADIDGESIVLGGSTDALDNAATEYIYLSSSIFVPWSATETHRYQLGQVCTLKKLYMLLSAAPGAGNSYTFTIRIAGADSNVVTTVADAATTGNSGALEDDLAFDEYVNLKVVPADTPDVVDAYWGFVCDIPVPTVGGGGAGAVVMGTKSLILDLLLEGVID